MLLANSRKVTVMMVNEINTFASAKFEHCVKSEHIVLDAVSTSNLYSARFCLKVTFYNLLSRVKAIVFLSFSASLLNN